jgi:PKD repeat protein/photosystem II stability/assembly factor-like uncharacterized protein
MGANGVYKSTDGAATWTRASTGLPAGDIRVVVVDPIVPSTLYAAGGGVFKSADGGGSWTAAGLSGSYVTTVAIDPQTPSVLYAGTLTEGVFKSSNAAGSWSASSVGLSNQTVRDFQIDPQTPSTVYVAVSNGVCKSLDSGATWAPSGAGITSQYLHCLALDPVTPSTLYAGTAAGVFKSTDGATSWSPSSLDIDLLSVTGLAVDPSTPDTLYAATYHTTSNVPIGIYKSTDGAATWTASNSGLFAYKALSLAIDPLEPSTVYAGIEGMGVYKSANAGVSWSLRNVGLPSTQTVRALAVDPSDPKRIYFGEDSLSCGCIFRSEDAGATWTPLKLGPIQGNVPALAIDPQTPSTLYAGTNGVYKSTDRGAHWTAAGTGLGTIQSIAIDPSTPSRLYAATYGGGVFKSTDGGTTWNPANTGLGATTNCIVIDPQNPSTLYAGREQGGVFKSTDGGLHWTSATSGLYDFYVIYSLAIDPVHTSTLYAGTNYGGIFKTTDGAANWSAVNQGLGGQTWFWSLAVDASNPFVLYAGGGGFRSRNGAASWQALNGGLPATGLRAIAIDPQHPSTLYAGTSYGVYGITQAACPTIAITPTSLPGAVQGAPYDQTLRASGWTSPYTASILSGSLPPGLSLGSAGVLSGTPTASGTYSFTVGAEDSAGCMGYGDFSIRVDPPCTLSCSASVSPGTGMAPLTVGFSASATASNCTGSVTYAWDFGDGQSSTQKNTSHTYDSPGTYTWAMAAAVSGAACTKTGTIAVMAPCSLTCEASATPAAGAAPLDVAFFASATSEHCTGVPTFSWAFGDGGASKVQNPTHTYSAMGNYAWTLTVTMDGKTCSKTGTIVVGEPCAVTCAGTVPKTGLAGDVVPFNATAEATHCAGDPAFVWTFGDGGTSTEQNPSHAYASAGSFTWALTVSADDETCTQTGTIEVGEVCAVTCTASATPASGEAPLAVAFTASATATNCSGLITFGWTFGDGGTSTEQNPSHIFAAPGTFTWALTVSIEGKTCSRTGTVTVVPPCVLTCEASATPNQGVAPLAVSFSGSATATNCTGESAYGWTFGDGGNSSEQNPNHTFLALGTYTWTLTVTAGTESCGETGTVTVEPGLPGDGNGDGVVSIGEVQQAINMFLGTQAPGNGVDCNGDGIVSIGEVQKVINAFLDLASAC